MNAYAQLRRFLLQDLLLILVLILGTIAALTFGAPATIAIPSAITLLIFLLLLLAMYLLNYRRTLARSAQIRAAQPQVQWQCTADEWQRFITSPQLQADLTSQVRTWQSSLLHNAVVISGSMFVILAFLYRDQGLAGLLGPLIVSLGLCGILIRSAGRVQQSLRHPYGQAEQPPQIVISAVGAILGSQPLLFKQPRAKITSTNITAAQPSALRIHLEYAMGRERILPYTVVIPVPEGHEMEAEMIRQYIPRT
jgi:hypothetical protein